MWFVFENPGIPWESSKARWKGQFVLLHSSLFLDYTQGCLYPGRVANWCLQPCIERHQRELLLCVPVWILQLSPDVQRMRRKACWGCVFLLWLRPVTDGTDSLYEQIQLVPVFIFLLTDRQRCSAVHLLGCCLQSTGSIHINVALFHTVIYAVLITPETCTKACKDIKVL